MRSEDDDDEWLDTVCETGEVCPKEGFWEQIETGRVDWHQTDDHFPELQLIPYKRAQYKYLGKKRKGV